MNTKIITTTLMILLFACSSGRKDNAILGFWQGELQFPGFESRIVLNINRQSERLSAILLKPDETEAKIPASSLSMKDKELHFEIESLNIIFNGIVDKKKATITGQWRQGSLVRPLTLRKVDEIVVPNRPQTPVPPFPYKSQEIVFTNDSADATLAGTLTWPTDGESFPAVVLLAGGGAHDRDYTIARHKFFWVIADDLTRRGIAVLRYDERGVGESTGDRSEATLRDMASDVLAGVRFLQDNSWIHIDRIGLLGHSEGGMIAQLAARESSDISFVITLGTPGLPGKAYQLQFEESSAGALGMSKPEIAARLEFQKQVFDILSNEMDRVVTREKLNELMNSINPPLPEEKRRASLNRFTSPWFLYNLRYDPAAVLQQIDCPVLALFGEKDLHVPPEGNVNALLDVFKMRKNPNDSLVVLPNMNHFFQINSRDIVFHYGKIEETISPHVLQRVGDWILNLNKDSDFTCDSNKSL